MFDNRGTEYYNHSIFSYPDLQLSGSISGNKKNAYEKGKYCKANSCII